MMKKNSLTKNYLFSLRYWREARKRPRRAWTNFWAIVRHPGLYFGLSTKVEGLIDHFTGMLLYDSVLKCKSNSVNVVEVGAFKGLSTCYLSLAAARVGKRVKSFELFSGLPTRHPDFDPTFQVGQFSSEMSEYERNLRDHGNRQFVDLIIGDARYTMLPTLGREGFCVAFLDVDVYEVMRDLLLQLATLVRGNEVIVVHDTSSPGVRKAIEEFHASYPGVARESRLDGNFVVKLQVCCLADVREG